MQLISNQHAQKDRRQRITHKHAHAHTPIMQKKRGRNQKDLSELKNLCWTQNGYTWKQHAQKRARHYYHRHLD